MLDEVTLVDTPGIGSTNARNTDAAYVALAECDAALFVCSAHPPITEAEVAYLARVRRFVPHVTIVLNKVDLTDGDDACKIAAFVSGVVAEQGGANVEKHIFLVSARHALAARSMQDVQALEESGLPLLERHMRSSLIERKRQVITRSIAVKMAELGAVLAADAAMVVKALSVSLEELDSIVAPFEYAAIGFERERTGLADALNGAWRRTVQNLGELCSDCDRRAKQDLAPLLACAGLEQQESSQAVVTAAIAKFFDQEFTWLTSTVEGELAATIKEQQRRHQALIDRVRKTAGSARNACAAACAR